MTAATPYRTLGKSICPWLQEPLRQFDAALGGGRLAHGWLLAGPEGVGKINLALAAAHRLLDGADAAVGRLGAEEAAAAMADRHEPTDHHPDLHWLFPEPGRRTLAVDRIREAAHALSLTSLAGRAKVLILEPADAMTTAAANALLKTLEEPPPRTYLLLVSHQPGRLPATVRSRCQSLPVPCPPAAETAAWLQHGGDDWAPLLALAQGSPFRAISFQKSNFLKKDNELNKKFHLISRNELDPQTVADEWLKGDLELSLSWLATRLQRVIRARMAPASTASGADFPANERAWESWTVRCLFQRLRNTETVLRQLGGGVNADLAVRALLLGFQPQGEGR